MQRIEDGYREQGYDGLRPMSPWPSSPLKFTPLSPINTSAGMST